MGISPPFLFFFFRSYLAFLLLLSHDAHAISRDGAFMVSVHHRLSVLGFKKVACTRGCALGTQLHTWGVGVTELFFSMTTMTVVVRGYGFFG